MLQNELKVALDEHDALLARCARGGISVREFLSGNDSFYQRWALDGHEGSTAVLSEFAERIEVHRKVWEQVECHITTEEFASNPAYREMGFIGEREALMRLRSIARQGGLIGPRAG